MVLGAGRARSRRRRARGRRERSSTVDVTDGTGYLHVHVLQPAVAGAPAAGRAPRPCSSASSTIFQGKRQMTNPVVDLIGDKTGRIVPVYPQSEKARLYHLGHRRLGRARRCDRGRRASLDPVPEPVLDRFDLVDRTRGASAASTCPSRWREAGGARKRLVFDELLRIQLALVLRKQALERDAPGHPPRPSAARSSTRFHERAAVRAHRRPAARRSPRSTADLGRPAPDAPAAAGRRRRRARRSSRVARHAHRRAGRAPGRAHGADRGARRAARLGVRALLDGFDRAGDGGRRCSTSGRCASSCSPTARRRRSASGCSPASPTARVDIVIGTHALHRGGRRVHVARRRGHRRAAPLRRRAARRAARQGRAATRARRAGDDGDADPAHRGDDRLRRPRRDACSTSCRRAARRSTTVWARRAELEEAGGVGSTCATRSAAGRQAYVVCPLIEESREARGALGRGDLRASSTAGPLAGLRLGLLHGRVTPAEKEATMDRVPRRRARRARRHHRDRGRRRRPQRHRDGRSSTPTASASPSSTSSGAGSGAAPTQSCCYLVGDGADARRRGAGSRRWSRTDRRLRAGRGRPRPAGRGHALRRRARRAATTSSWRRCGATGTWSWSARSSPFDLVDADPGLADAPRPARRGRAPPRRRGHRVPREGLSLTCTCSVPSEGTIRCRFGSRGATPRRGLRGW